MGKIIKLMAGNHMLKLEADNSSNWCKVYFFDHQKGSSVLLGADDLKSICSKLYSALKMENLNGKEIYKHETQELFWILSLFEQHTSIYGSLTDNLDMKIFCVEDCGCFLPEVHLEKQDIEKWILTIEKEVCDVK